MADEVVVLYHELDGQVRRYLQLARLEGGVVHLNRCEGARPFRGADACLTMYATPEAVIRTDRTTSKATQNIARPPS